MTTRPSIESLRDMASAIRERMSRMYVQDVTIDAIYLADAAITELESLRAENEALRAISCCVSCGDQFDAEHQRGTCGVCLNAERARADALKARVEALKPLLAALESALKVAEEAFGFLGEVRYFCTHCCGQEPDLAASGAMAVCKKCGYCMGRIDPRSEYVAALAAIRGVKNKSGTGVDADSNPTTLREGE